jgi:hypothetical protein
VKKLIDPLDKKLKSRKDEQLNLPSLIYKQHEILLNESDLDLIQIFYKADASRDVYSDVDVARSEISSNLPQNKNIEKKLSH